MKVEINKRVLNNLNNWLEKNEFVVVKIEVYNEEFTVVYYDALGNKKVQFFS